MKIALLKVGCLPFANLKTTSSQQFYGIYNVMKSAGYDVDILTHKKTEWSKAYSEIKDINTEYDYLFAYNGPINFYAGAICESMINNYMMMNKWNKPIHFLYNDPNLPWKEIWPGMKSKPWNTWKEEDVAVTSDLIILSNMMESDYKVGKAKHKGIKNKISFNYFPFNEWILYGIEKPGDIKNTAECDLIYGGSFRGGNREKKMVDYFFDKNKINVNLFGTIKLEKFNQEQIKGKKAPTFLGKQKMEEVLNVGAKGFASIIFGDKTYNNNLITLRVFESILSGSITFIDNDFDTEHKIFNDEFFYVNNGQELEEKILIAKNDKALHQRLIECQNEYYNRVKAERNIEKILKDILK